MSSAATSNLAEIEVSSSQVDDEGVVAITSPKKDLNPNAAAFDSLSYLTISDEGTLGDAPIMTNTNNWEEHSPTEEHNSYSISGDSGQYSPGTVNGYGSYTSPITPEMTQTGMPELSPDSLPLEELKTLLKRQLEFYFSRENLSSDTYLVSQMDNDQYVPVWTVANFNQVKKLTTNIDLVTGVMRESPHLQVDESGEKVRPNVKRCIVVLREIPESTPVEEVRELFSGHGCPKWTSCEFASNNYWYIQFETEGDAQKAYRYLREEVRTFKGNAIMARIKAKPIHQSNYLSKNGLRLPQQPQVQSQAQQPMVETQPVYSQRHFQFPPVAPMYTGQQPFSFYPSPVLHQTWPPGQPLFPDPAMPHGFPNGFHHGPALKQVGPGNTGRHTYQGSRARFQNKTPHHRDQQADRSDRDAPPKNRPQSTNGSVNPAQGNNRNATGTFRQRDGPREGDDSSRRLKNNRRRRGSSEDISKHLRQRESRASPIRHSKDDSDTLDLAPSQFPPLPTSPLVPFVKEKSLQKPIVTSNKEKPECKQLPSPQTEDAPRPSPAQSPNKTKVEATQQSPESTPLHTPKMAEVKAAPVQQENTPASLDKLSYAQVTQKTSPKPTNSNQIKSPSK